MKDNKIYWKINHTQHAKEVIQCFNTKVLIIELVERKNNRMKKLKVLNVAHLPNMTAVDEQLQFLENNKISNMYQFYIIKTV